MSYSNRPLHRPDPTVSPYARDAQGNLRLRDPFTPTAYQEAKRNAASEARKRNRKGVAFHGRALELLLADGTKVRL